MSLQRAPKEYQHATRPAHRSSIRPAPLTKAQLNPMLQLQQAMGNRAVQRLIQSQSQQPWTHSITSAIQAKLTVGAAGDKYEQEADQVASRVMTMPAPAAPQPIQRVIEPEEEKHAIRTKPVAESITPLVQRQMGRDEDKDKPVQARSLPASTVAVVQRATHEDDKEKRVQAKPLAASITPRVQAAPLPSDEKDKLVQAKSLVEESHGPLQQSPMPEDKDTQIQQKASLQQTATAAGFQTGHVFEARLNRSKGTGSALPDPVLAFMEPRFGVNLKDVRVHADEQSVQMNQDIAAQAFTHGRDIYYGAGKAPAISDLTAHELTHVIQQTGGKPLTAVSPPHLPIASHRLQRYTVPSNLLCDNVVDWLGSNSPYSPEWAQTACTYTFKGKLRVSPPDTSGGNVRVTVTGHKGLSVSARCPIDTPQWSPSPRPNRAAVVTAWKNMKRSLNAHEQQHRTIAETWRAILQARFRAVNFTVSGVDHADAMMKVQQEVAALQQQWTADAQAAQDAIDPFTGAILACP